MNGRRIAFLAAAALLAACNPNFGMGSAPDSPPDWKAPPGAGDDDSGAPGMDDLVAKLQEKVKASTTDFESRKQLGLLYAEMGKWDDAAKIFEEAEAVDPKNVEVRVARAKVLIRRKDQGAAKAELDTAAKLAPDDEALLREWGDYYIFAEDMAEAVKARKRLLAKHPDIADAEAVEKQMFYLARFPKLREEKKLKEFFDLAGSAAQAQEKLRDDEAIEKFKQAIAYIPDDPNLWTDLGVSQRRAGKKEEAVASFRKALSFDKDHSQARLALAKALAAEGDRKGATATLTEWQKVDARRAKQHDADVLVAKIAKGESLETAAAPIPHPGTKGAPGAIRGTVRVAPALAGKIPPGAKFYVFAKQNQGAGPPLAVQVQKTVPAFPYSFELTGDDVMMQGTEFNGAVFLTARIDADGSAGAGPGDLEGASSGAIPVGTDGVDLVIDRIRGADGQLTAAAGGGAIAAPAPTTAPSSSGGSTVAGTIDVSPALRGKLPASATLFVFAKTNPGGGPPLAVHREPITSATKFPIAFSLSQNDVMMQGMEFAGAVYVTARIDVDGVAGAGPGDLEGVTKSAIPVGTTDVHLTIDTVR